MVTDLDRKTHRDGNTGTPPRLEGS